MRNPNLTTSRVKLIGHKIFHTTTQCAIKRLQHTETWKWGETGPIERSTGGGREGRKGGGGFRGARPEVLAEVLRLPVSFVFRNNKATRCLRLEVIFCLAVAALLSRTQIMKLFFTVARALWAVSHWMRHCVRNAATQRPLTCIRKQGNGHRVQYEQGPIS